MTLTLIGHEDRYAVEQLQMSLFDHSGEGSAISSLHRGKIWLTAITTITIGGKTVTARQLAAEGSRRIGEIAPANAAAMLLCRSCSASAQSTPLGRLAGVRPTKITTRHLLEGGTPKTADALMKNIYYVTAPRRQLAIDCSLSTVNAVHQMDKQDISLYVGIPFCPTRCAYCSFVSRTIGKHTERLDAYLDALYKEIRLTGELMANSGKSVRTIYIGGGTPTTLSTPQMTQLLDTITGAFDMSRCIEFTVEGGRPDTLTPEKLAAIRRHGADRMSINPQTMMDPVLRACGRPHKAADVLEAYHWAENAGFDAINMDLIAGVPQDDFAGFCQSLDQVAALSPANITVHTLALKKGADLFEKRVALPTAEEVTRMVEYANQTLRSLGYKPYYLYRQKYMSGSFENVGWSKDGKDCLYNIYMMEELHSIVSLGGGGMNKVNLPDGHLQRFHNPKFPEQYIEMIDSVLEDKKKLFELL